MQCPIEKKSIWKISLANKAHKRESGLRFVSYFVTRRCRVLKLSWYSSSHLQMKVHGDLECLQICHTKERWSHFMIANVTVHVYNWGRYGTEQCALLQGLHFFWIKVMKCYITIILCYNELLILSI